MTLPGLFHAEVLRRCFAPSSPSRKVIPKSVGYDNSDGLACRPFRLRCASCPIHRIALRHASGVTLAKHFFRPVAGKMMMLTPS